MVILGIDASTTSTGFAVFNNEELIDYGTIKPKGEDWRSRLVLQGKELNKVIKANKPEMVVIEDVPLKKQNPKALVILGAVQGYLLGVLARFDLDIRFVFPSEWRSKVGMFDGSRDGTHRDEMKKKSIELANKLFNLDLKWVSPKSKFNEDDISDAILLAYSQIKKRKFIATTKTKE